MDSQSRRDWSALAAPDIPTKQETPALDTFVSQLPAGARVLDLGCGNGGVTRKLVARGLVAVGVDLHVAALEAARVAVPEARFYERDVAAVDGLQLPEARFDAVICQLLLSIVGDAADRARLLHNARAWLAPGAALYASLSGLSEDLNPEYAATYARDAPLTGEHGTYLSRDSAGRVLYRTHHFSRPEIEALLRACSFEPSLLEERIEASSRRPEQRARFYYLVARPLS